MGRKVEVLDGEAYRENTKHDRDTNIRQIRYVAKLLTRNGVVVIAAAICPYQSGRAINSKAIGRFIEVFCRRSLAVAERRNVKGLYRRSRNGEIKFFTAIDDRYEEPLGAEVIVDTDKEIVGESVEKIWQTLRRIGYV
jgi:adenylylsulfate kinase